MTREDKTRRANGTGSVCEFRENGKTRYKIGILVDGKQVWKRCKPGTSKAMAGFNLDSWVEKASADPDLQPGGDPGALLKDWFDDWFDDRDAHGIQTKVDRGRMRKHVPASLMSKPAAHVTPADLESIVETLDRKVAKAETKWKNAANIWGVISKAFDDMAHGKTRSLRIRTDNPAADVRGPDRGAKTLKQYLYPSEFLEFVTCDHPDVSLEWRVFVTVATYLYTRPGELEALEWSDVQIDRGTIHVHRAIDREKGGTKSTKTETPRKFQIEPALLPLLRVLHKSSGGQGKVFPSPPYGTSGARDFRRLLLKAGVDRAELHAMGDPNRKALTVYDLRATGITWRAVRGDDPLKIKSSAGHKRFSTTEGYIREAEASREGFGDVFPELPDLSKTTPKLLRGVKKAGIQVELKGIEPEENRANAGDTGETQGVPDSVPPQSQDTKPAIAGDRSSPGVDPTPPNRGGDPVELALATALTEATKAGRWDVVVTLAAELEARRRARSDVVDLDVERHRRDRGTH